MRTSLFLLLLLGCSSSPTMTADAGSDAASPIDGNVMNDSAVDAGGGAPKGFTLAAPRTTADIVDLSMALDENGDPLLSYIVLDSPNRVEFVRWDRAQNKFSSPLVIDSVGTIDSNEPHRSTSIAFDLSNKTIGIVYQKVVSNHYELEIVSSTDGGKNFSMPEPAIDYVPMVLNQSGHDPSLEMANGKFHLAYVQDWQLCTVGACSAAYYATRTGNSGMFTRMQIQMPAMISARVAPVSLALDGSSAPAVVFFGREQAGYNTHLYYARPGSMAVKVTDSANIQNDVVSASLVFNGNEPSIAYHLVAAQNATYEMRFSKSLDGMTWTTAPVARGGGTQQSVGFQSLTAGKNGKLALAARWSSGPASGCSGPILLRSADKMTFSGCGPDPKTFGPAGSWVNLEYASDDALRMAFVYGGTDFSKGIVFWRE